jgi:hypothetical protein
MQGIYTYIPENPVSLGNTVLQLFHNYYYYYYYYFFQVQGIVFCFPSHLGYDVNFLILTFCNLFVLFSSCVFVQFRIVFLFLC